MTQFLEIAALLREIWLTSCYQPPGFYLCARHSAQNMCALSLKQKCYFLGGAVSTTNQIPLSLMKLCWDTANISKPCQVTPQLLTARLHSRYKQTNAHVHASFKSYLSTWGMANMNASWNMIHKVPVRKYGPNLRASVLSRKKPELCSFCSFLRSWAWSGSLLPSATPDAKAFSCLPEGQNTHS